MQVHDSQFSKVFVERFKFSFKLSLNESFVHFLEISNQVYADYFNFPSFSIVQTSDVILAL